MKHEKILQDLKDLAKIQVFLWGVKFNKFGGKTMNEIVKHTGMTKKHVGQLIMGDMRRYSESTIDGWSNQHTHKHTALRYFLK
jgi:hypothetical protein